MSSRQQQMCNITSGMVTNYVAAARGSFVQKNLPFVWKNKERYVLPCYRSKAEMESKYVLL